MIARLIPFLRKEAAEKEVVEKEADKKDDEEEEEEDQESWPSGSNDDDSPTSPIRFPRDQHCFKCPICVNYLYEHKNILLFHIENFIKDEMSPPDVVEQHRQLSRLLEATMRDP
jgi:hypothetical protein